MTRKGPVHAISGMVDAHIADQQALRKQTENGTGPFEHTHVFLDVGARSKEDAEALGIRPGDPIAPWSPFMILANNRYAAKAWDDRIGLVIQLEVLRRMKERGIRPPNTLYMTGTVQEELWLRGAVTTSHIVQPDLGIALEVGVAADYPGATPELAEERLGGGPGIHLFDSSMLPNLKLRDFFFHVAEEKKIPLQTDLVVRYGQDRPDADPCRRHARHQLRGADAVYACSHRDYRPGRFCSGCGSAGGNPFAPGREDRLRNLAFLELREPERFGADRKPERVTRHARRDRAAIRYLVRYSTHA